MTRDRDRRAATRGRRAPQLPAQGDVVSEDDGEPAAGDPQNSATRIGPPAVELESPDTDNQSARQRRWPSAWRRGGTGGGIGWIAHADEPRGWSP